MMRRPSSRRADLAVGRALRAAVSTDPDSAEQLRLAIEVAGWNALVSAAQRHGVAGWVWQAVRTTGLAAEPEAAELRAGSQQALARHLRTLSDLDAVMSMFASAGIRSLTVKGPVLIELGYERPDLRSYVDLDVMVRPADFPAALALAESAGSTLVERNWPLVQDRMLGELTLVQPSGGLLDLHWHLLHERGIWDEFNVNIVECWERSRSVRVGSVDLETLSAEDTLLHVAMHAGLSGAHRLIWLADIHQLVARERIDWDVLIGTARRWRVEALVGLVLTRARRVLGTIIPPRATALAGHWSWRGLGWVADTVAPVHTWRGRGSVNRLVARATRASVPRSLGQLARNSTSAAAEWLRGDNRVNRLLFDPANPAAAAYPDGGPSERAVYLGRVAATDPL